MSGGSEAGRPTVVDKERRQRLLADLLAEADLASQEEVIAGLAERGVRTTQATVSRDLKELRAVKVRAEDGRLVYRLATDVVTGEDHDRLVEVLATFVTSVEASRGLVVLRTPPAGAGPVASAIDLGDIPGALATIAGDDTVLVVAAEGTDADGLARRLASIADLA